MSKQENRLKPRKIRDTQAMSMILFNKPGAHTPCKPKDKRLARGKVNLKKEGWQ